MASNRMINIQKAIDDIDAKMEKILHRRSELEAQLSRLRVEPQGTPGTTSHREGPVSTGVGISTASETTSFFSGDDEHKGDLGTLAAFDAFMAIASLVAQWEVSDNQVCEALQTLDPAWDISHVANSDQMSWLRSHASDLRALANAYGFNARWLNRLSY